MAIAGVTVSLENVNTSSSKKTVLQASLSDAILCTYPVIFKYKWSAYTMNLVVGEGGRSGQLANTTFRRLNQENGSAELGFDSINASPYSCCIK